MEYDGSEQHHHEQPARNNDSHEHLITHRIVLRGRDFLSTANSARMPSSPGTLFLRLNLSILLRPLI